MGTNPHANGGELLVPLSMPHFRDYAVEVTSPGASRPTTRAFSASLCVMKLNLASQNFRLFGPDETASNRLDAVYEASPKEWMARVEDVDVEAPSPSRVVKRRRTTRDPNVLLFGA